MRLDTAVSRHHDHEMTRCGGEGGPRGHERLAFLHRRDEVVIGMRGEMARAPSVRSCPTGGSVDRSGSMPSPPFSISL